MAVEPDQRPVLDGDLEQVEDDANVALVRIPGRVAALRHAGAGVAGGRQHLGLGQLALSGGRGRCSAFGNVRRGAVFSPMRREGC